MERGGKLLANGQSYWLETRSGSWERCSIPLHAINFLAKLYSVGTCYSDKDSLRYQSFHRQYSAATLFFYSAPSSFS